MKYALLFPGQGSQRVGMGMDIHAGSPDARALFKKADDALGYSLSKLCFEGPDDELRQTINTQPALFVTSCAALMTLWTRVEVTPFAVAGHSVGEYAALFAAGAVGFEKGLELVGSRAGLMQTAAESRPGVMAAVLGLEADEVRAACEAAKADVGGVATIANLNCTGQIVISGLAETVERAGELAKQRGAKRVLMLPVSGGFHSPLMVAAGDALYPALREAMFQNPRVPVVTNVNAEYTKNGVDFAPLLTMQVSGSVRWEESMQRLLADGVRTFIEVGSGDVLCGMMKRIDKTARTLSVQDMASLKAAVALIEEMNSLPDESVSSAGTGALMNQGSTVSAVAKPEASPAVTEAHEQNRAAAVESVPVVVVEPEEPKEPATQIFHITKVAQWQACLLDGAYRPPSLETEGFIHASRPEQVADTANNHFRARTGLVLLDIDATKVKPEIRYERAENGRIYPHIYGPLNVDAIKKIIDFPPGADGRFKLPDT